MANDFEFDVEIIWQGAAYQVAGQADITIDDNYPYPGESANCHWWKAERIDAPDDETQAEAWRKANFVDGFRELVREAILRQHETAPTGGGHEDCDVRAEG